MACVLIVIPGFAKDENDSLCLPAMQQFILSAQRSVPDLQLVILSLQYPFQSGWYTWHGIPVMSIAGNNKPGLYRLFTWIKALYQLRLIRKRYQPVGVLSLWLHETALVSKWFCRLNRLPHYIWLQGQDVKKSNQYVNRVKARAEELIAISEFTRDEYFRNHGIRPFLVVNNGVNRNIFPALDQEERAIDILGVGSLIALKNYSLFLDIIHALVPSFPHLKVVIAGEGPEQTALMEKTRELSIAQHVTFMGAVPHAEALDLMRRSKLFLHTSTFEGNSTVLIEALYSGCRVFSTIALGTATVENLHLCSDKDQFVRQLKDCLLDTNTIVKRVEFNNMETSAKIIFGLFTPGQHS